MPTDITELSLPAVEREITTLAGHLAAATCRFLQLLSVFDAGDGWRGYGLRSCPQWLSWKCGLSPGTAREQLRVAHALDRLPAVREAFATGRLSYSKARALTRVVTPENEAQLVGTATACTASQLDRLCSGIARARSNDQVLDQAARASFSSRWEQDGSLRFAGRLSAEDGAVLLAALAAVRPDPVGDPAPEADGAEVGDRAGGDVPTGAGGRGVDRPDAARAAAHSDAAAIVLIARHALSVPPSEVGAAPVRLVVHAKDSDFDQTVSAAALDRRTAAELASTEASAAVSPSAEAPAPERASADVPAESASLETPTAAVLDAGPGIPLLPLGPDTLHRLACDALVEPAANPDADESSDGAGPPRARRRQHRFASAPQRRALLARDLGCAFPGCSRRRDLHAHHVRPWYEGGSTTVRNLVLACEHHHKLVHEGGWQLRRGPDRRWQAVSPDGRVLTAAPHTGGDADDLAEAHDADIVAETVTGNWLGDPLHLDYAVSVYA